MVVALLLVSVTTVAPWLIAVLIVAGLLVSVMIVALVHLPASLSSGVKSSS